MGADNSILSKAEWTETFTDTGQGWVIKNGDLENGVEISMFTVPKKDSKQRELLRKLAKQLKSVRHPAILHYTEFGEGVDGPFLITEQVVPLQSVREDLSAIEICSGLHTVLEALCFLHEKAGICHNNVCQKSVYVCHDGSWRLGGLEHSCKFSEVTPAFLQSTRALRYEEGLAPEEKQEKIEVGPELGHARDVYSFAVMAEELLEKLTELGDMTKTFELRIQDECLNADPRKRPKIESLLNDRLFTTEFLQIATFLKNVAVKSEDDRKSFFMNLLPKLLSLPEELVGRRLVPLILSRFAILDQTACQFVLPHILTPCTDEDPPTEVQEEITPVLTVSCYKRFVIPLLVKIFTVHDHHIRMVLLHFFPLYANLIDQEVLEFEIYPQLLLGLRDISDDLAASSLRALADLVPILGRDFVIGGRAKNYFRKGMPKKNEDGAIAHTNDKPNNVNSVMGKTLLKDLAKLSAQHNPNSVSEEEKDRKWKEREKRREEVKLRREQRKREKENKLKEISHSIVKDEPTPSPNDVGDNDTQNDSIDAQDIDKNNPSGDMSEERSEVNKLEESDWLQKKSHITNGEMEKDDWSDWDDGEIESHISEEIERELETMELTEKVNVDEKKNDNLKQKNTTIVSDLSKSTIHSKGGALKLEKKVKPTKTVNESSQKTYVEATEGVKATNFSQVKKQSQNKTSKYKSVTFNPNTDLGAEFDIKNVNIKVDPVKKNDPFDFFADMAPSISYSEPLHGLQPIQTGGSLNLEVTQEEKIDTDLKVNTAKFDVVATQKEMDDGGGWGDDDWGTEDF